MEVNISTAYSVAMERIRSSEQIWSIESSNFHKMKPDKQRSITNRLNDTVCPRSEQKQLSTQEVAAALGRIL